MIAPLLELFPTLTDEVGNFTAFGAEVVIGFGKDRCHPARNGYDAEGLKIFAVCRRYADGRPIRVKVDGHWATTGRDPRRTLDLAWQAVIVGDLWEPYDENPSIEGFVVGEIRREDYASQSRARVTSVLGLNATDQLLDLSAWDLLESK